MVKIKQKVEMTLPKLIEWGFKNGIKNKAFVRDRDSVRSQLNFKPIAFNSIGYVEFSNDYSYSPEDTFTVEVEKEITQETKLPKCLEIYFDDKVAKADEINVYMDKSIGEILQESKIYQFKTKAIYLFGDNGNLTPIWKDGELVGDE